MAILLVSKLKGLISKTNGIDWLNIALILTALFFAFQMPYHLFLVAYAVLGPLHYLTEINWVRSKNYFVRWRIWIWVAIILSLAIVMPRILSAFGLRDQNSAILGLWQFYSNAFIGVALALAIGMGYTKKNSTLILIGIFTFLVGIVIGHMPIYLLTMGLLLPTLVHVYLFTILFMLSGAIRARSQVGLFSVFLMILVPFVIMIVPVQPSNYLMNEDLKNVFLQNGFHETTVKIAAALGLLKGDTFFFFEKVEWRLQIFIAFAYTYHYLNWFSKTTVIKWHQDLSISRTLLILGLWIVSISLFWYDYRTGFLALIGLSFLHMILEFPLNISSIRNIFSFLKGKTLS